MVRRLLACFAHPDDEAFSVAGTLARYARQDVDVALVCATRGEKGEISDPHLASPETLPQVREEEMRCAAAAIGASELIFLGYRDSGMAGTEDNQHPEAFRNAPAREVDVQLVEIMRRRRPEVVLTFDPYGGYGHPDHIAIHAHTVAAFHAAGNGACFPEQGAPWQPERLFYTPILRSQIRKMQEALYAAGEDGGEMDQFASAIQWPEEQIHLVMDISPYFDAKWQAICCHRTQVGENHPFRKMSPEAAKRIMGEEAFALAWPLPAPGLRLSGLFAEG